MTTAFWTHKEAATVPFRALLLSVLAFSVPVMGVTLAPDWATEEQGTLLWLSALLPPFLLTYYRGWGGASIGLAAGMAALVTTHLGILLLGAGTPNYESLLWIVATYIVVCVGAGLLGEVLKQQRRVAEEMALTDPLTGLPNHRHAAVFLDAAFSGAARGQPVSVVFFSLDDFDTINERFGRQTGEQVLRRFGAILTELTRRMDLSARWNGRDFVSILSRCKAGGAAAFTSRVQDELRADIFPWGKVSASAGIAEFDPGMGSLELLLAAADRAAFVAREGGGDRYEIAGIRSQSFEGREEPRNPSTQRGSLRLESSPSRGFQLVPAPREERSGTDLGGVAPGNGRVSLPTGKERVLVVNDDSAERASIGKTMKGLGYSVVEASDGEAALGKARSFAGADLLIADLIMPGMSGFTLVERFEREFGPQRVLYLSGYIQGEVSWPGAPGAVVAFVSKTVTDGELAATSRALLDRSLVPPEPDLASALV